MRYRARAYPSYGRIVSAILLATSRGSLLVMLALLMFFETRLGNQLRLMKVFATFCLVPGAAAWLLDHAFAATAWFEGGTLVLDQRTRRVEVPSDAVADVVPWRVPIPPGGLWLRLKSGKRFAYGLSLDDPTAFVDELVAAGARQPVRATGADPTLLYTRAKNTVPRRWYHPILKFVVFGLVPTLPLFRLHQWIAYGGTFGEYYTYGLEAYLIAFAIYWATLIIYLMLYAALLRSIVEAVSLAAAYLAPARAEAVRSLAELAQRFAYYGGIPLLLVRFLLHR